MQKYFLCFFEEIKKISHLKLDCSIQSYNNTGKEFLGFNNNLYKLTWPEISKSSSAQISVIIFGFAFWKTSIRKIAIIISSQPELTNGNRN